jgi:hypothetical protein
VSALLPALGQQPVRVSLPQVLSNPRNYDGKLIEVHGFMLQEFENSALYSGKEWRRSKGIWITPTDELARRRSELNRHYVVLTGVFDANSHGHLGQFKGTLTVKTFRLLQGDIQMPPAKNGDK